jgi:hypothetical protein
MFQPDNPNFIAKRDSNLPEILPYESVLAEGLRGFLSELVMINGAVMVSYICNNQHANLDDIIVSSTECAIKPGHLYYGNHAHIEFDWGKAPSVAIAMELRDNRLTAFFEVVLGENHVGVDIRGIHFADRPGDAEENLRRFAAVVSDCRLSSGTATGPTTRA